MYNKSSQSDQFSSTKRGRAYAHLLIVFLTLAVLFSFTSFTASAKAAPSSWVLIAKDTTNSTCVSTIVVNPQTSHSTTAHQKCSPWTFILYSIVSQTQAVAQHEPYQPLSSRTPTILEREQKQAQLEQQIASYQKALALAVPNIGCGSTAIVGHSETLEADFIEGDVDYQKSYSCNSVVINWLRMQLYGQVNSPLFWDNTVYLNASNGNLDTPNKCLYVSTTPTTLSVTTVPVQPVGHNVSFDLNNYDCSIQADHFSLVAGPLN